MGDPLSWRLAASELSGRDPPAGGAAGTDGVWGRRGQFALPVPVASDYAGAAFRRPMVHSRFSNHYFGSVVGFSHGDFDWLICLCGKRGGGVKILHRFKFAYEKTPLD